MARHLSVILAMILLLIGLLWIGQGLNIIRWPASSFMIGRPVWSWNGSALLLVGAVMLWFARRR